MPGETIGIVIESGCGKSTTANVVMALVVTSVMYFKGMDVTKRTPELRSRLAALSPLFQDPAAALNPRMIVKDQHRIHYNA